MYPSRAVFPELPDNTGSSVSPSSFSDLRCFLLSLSPVRPVSFPPPLSFLRQTSERLYLYSFFPLSHIGSCNFCSLSRFFSPPRRGTFPPPLSPQRGCLLFSWGVAECEVFPPFNVPPSCWRLLSPDCVNPGGLLFSDCARASTFG